MPERNSKMSRRRFLDYLLGITSIAWLGTVLYPVIRFFKPPKSAEAVVTSLKVINVSELPPDSGLVFKFGRKPGLLIHTPDGQIKAFDGICTHLDCTVQYSQERQQIWCACHNGRYDLNGINVGGPPPRPLPAFKVNIDESGDIFVSKEA
jgi:Rieske Fe-S protein